MSDIIRAQERVLKHSAVYWGVKNFETAHGRPSYEPPIEIKCRWTDSAEQYIDDSGHVHISNAVVMVDRDLDIQGVLWLGKLRDVLNEAVPLENEGAYEVKRRKRLANKKGNKYFREVFL